MNTKDLIIEDVLYIKTDENNNVVSGAKDTFYYQFLMENGEGRFANQCNKKSAEDFYVYQQLFLYLYKKGYLLDEHYALQKMRIESGYIFTFNLGKFLETHDLEEELNKAFEKEHFSEYIHTLCCPADSFRCAICGAVTISQKRINSALPCICLGCDNIAANTVKKVKNELKKNGTIAAVQKRLDIIKEEIKIHLPSGVSIQYLIAKFIKENEIFEGTVSEEVKKVLIEKGYIVLETEIFGVVILDMQALSNIDNFSKAFFYNKETNSLDIVFNTEYSFTNEKSLEFIEKLTQAINNTKHTIKSKESAILLLEQFKMQNEIQGDILTDEIKDKLKTAGYTAFEIANNGLIIWNDSKITNVDKYAFGFSFSEDYGNINLSINDECMLTGDDAKVFLQDFLDKTE